MGGVAIGIWHATPLLIGPNQRQKSKSLTTKMPPIIGLRYDTLYCIMTEQSFCSCSSIFLKIYERTSFPRNPLFSIISR